MSCAHASTSSCHSPLIRVRGLGVQYDGCEYSAVTGLDLDIAPGEVIGVLGESGSGKSTMALSLLGLLPTNTKVRGSISFLDPAIEVCKTEATLREDLLQIDEARWRAIRGARISMIFQEPALSLSPVMRVGDQILEVLRAHRPNGTPQGAQVETILRQVHLADADRIYNAYPHQLSGGQLHRIVIAQALCCRPALVIADEPTRSLDGMLQSEVLEILRETNREVGSALLFITHNPALLAGFADRVIVMYAGRIVEEGPLGRIFRHPLHPYTKALLQLIPSASKPDRTGRNLPMIPGSLTDSDRLARGCVFESRCPARIDACRNEYPATVAAAADHHVSCFNYGN